MDFAALLFVKLVNFVNSFYATRRWYFEVFICHSAPFCFIFYFITYAYFNFTWPFSENSNSSSCLWHYEVVATILFIVIGVKFLRREHPIWYNLCVLIVLDTLLRYRRCLLLFKLDKSILSIYLFLYPGTETRMEEILFLSYSITKYWYEVLCIWEWCSPLINFLFSLVFNR